MQGPPMPRRLHDAFPKRYFDAMGLVSLLTSRWIRENQFSTWFSHDEFELPGGICCIAAIPAPHGSRRHASMDQDPMMPGVCDPLWHLPYPATKGPFFPLFPHEGKKKV